MELDTGGLLLDQQHHAGLAHAAQRGWLSALSALSMQRSDEHQEAAAEALAVILQRCPLSHLCLTAPSTLHAVDLSAPYTARALLCAASLSPSLDSLRCLRLISWHLTADTLRLLTHAFHHHLARLEELDLTEWRAHAYDLPAVAQTVGAALASGRLRILRVCSDAALPSIDADGDFEDQLSAQLQGHPCALEELALCNAVFSPAATMGVLQHNTHLTSLHLGTFHWSDQGRALGTLTRLTHLWLRYDTEDLPTVSSGLQRLIGLVTLHLDFFDDADSVDSSVLVAAIGHMPHLSTLSMCHLDRLSLVALVQHCPLSVRGLCLDNVMVSDSAAHLAGSLGPALQRLTALERLQFQQLFFASETAPYLALAGSIATALPSLQQLRHLVLRNDAAMVDTHTSCAIRAACLALLATVCCSPSRSLTADIGLDCLDATAACLAAAMLSNTAAELIVT